MDRLCIVSCECRTYSFVPLSQGKQTCPLEQIICSLPSTSPILLPTLSASPFALLQPTTQESVDSALAGYLQQTEGEELTILLLGKGGVGKSSTVNSLFNERVANVSWVPLVPSRECT
jgi:hypothetical protein